MTHSHTIFTGRLHLRAVSFCSSAEGFVFVSGLVAGLHLYCRKDSYRNLLRNCWARLSKLYTYHLLLLAATFALAFLCPEAPEMNYSSLASDPGRAWVYSMLLIHQPELMDILPLYMGTTLLLPVLAGLLSAGWRLTLLFLSGALWALTWYNGAPASLDGWRAGFACFSAWQLLYVGALLCAYTHRERRIDWSGRGLSRLALGVVFLCFSLEGLRLLDHHPIWSTESWLHSPAFERLISLPLLGPLRLANFLALAQVVYRFQNRLIPRSPALALMGRYSLEVFAAHIVLLQVLYCLRAGFDYASIEGFGMRIAVDSLSLFLVVSAMWSVACWRASRSAT